MSRSHMVTLMLVSLWFSTGAVSAQHKIYISADMEGVVGVVTGEQLGPGGLI